MNTPTSIQEPTTSKSPDRRRLAVWAGLSYIALFVLAIFANFGVRERLVEQADPAATFVNLAQSQQVVRLAILAFIIIFVLDVFVSWALYHVFRPAGASLSALTAWFRIVYTVFLGVAVVFLFVVLGLVADSSTTQALGRSSREAATMLALDAFNVTWLIGLVAFGIHLMLIGAMILRSGMAHRVLGVVLAIAGLAYVFDTTAYTVLADYSANADVFTAIVAVPAVIAEAAFTIWLLRRGGKDTGTTVIPTGSTRLRNGQRDRTPAMATSIG